MRGRLTFDALAIGASIIVAYIFFMRLFRREGTRYFRAHAEIGRTASANPAPIPVPTNCLREIFLVIGRSLSDQGM